MDDFISLWILHRRKEKAKGPRKREQKKRERWEGPWTPGRLRSSMRKSFDQRISSGNNTGREDGPPPTPRPRWRGSSRVPDDERTRADRVRQSLPLPGRGRPQRRRHGLPHRHHLPTRSQRAGVRAAREERNVHHGGEEAGPQ